MRRLMLASLAVAMCLVATSRASAELIVNGGFETGDFTAWTVTGPFNGITTPFAASGDYSAELGSTVLNFGTLSQSVVTEAGNQYQISFFMNCFDDNNSGPTNFFDVYFDGVLLYSETNRPDDGPVFDDQFIFTVIGNGAAQELLFVFGNDAGYFYVDDVSVAVPVPAGFIMAGMGALGLAGMHLRRRVLARKAQLA